MSLNRITLPRTEREVRTESRKEVRRPLEQLRQNGMAAWVKVAMWICGYVLMAESIRFLTD